MGQGAMSYGWTACSVTPGWPHLCRGSPGTERGSRLQVRRGQNLGPPYQVPPEAQLGSSSGLGYWKFRKTQDEEHGGTRLADGKASYKPIVTAL